MFLNVGLCISLKHSKKKKKKKDEKKTDTISSYLATRGKTHRTKQNTPA